MFWTIKLYNLCEINVRFFLNIDNRKKHKRKKEERKKKKKERKKGKKERKKDSFSITLYNVQLRVSLTV